MRLEEDLAQNVEPGRSHQIHQQENDHCAREENVQPLVAWHFLTQPVFLLALLTLFFEGEASLSLVEAPQLQLDVSPHFPGQERAPRPPMSARQLYPLGPAEHFESVFWG